MKESSGRIRIALALEYPLLQYGGTEALVRELVQGLAARFEIVLVSGDRDRAALGEPFASLIADHLYWDKAAPSREAARTLAAALVEKGIKLAHFHGGGIYDWQCHKFWQSPLYYLTGTNIPCVMTSHIMTKPLEGYTRPDRPLWQKALLFPKAWLSKALLLSRVKSEFLVSKHDQAHMREIFPIFAGKIRQMYHSKLVRSDGGLPQDQRKKIIFCLGTFGQRKGQIFLSRAFASIAKKHPDWTLNMMGRPETEGYLEMVQEIVRETGITNQVEFTPSKNDPKPFLESVAIFAMPSLREGLGLSLQEALYDECACVGSSVGGIPELIENDKTGLLVPPADVPALAAALDRLMSEPELRLRLTHRARQSIIEKGMLAEIMVENHAQLYESILAGKEIPLIQPSEKI